MSENAYITSARHKEAVEASLRTLENFFRAFQNGEYDVVRRGIVLPTADEMASMLAMFEPRLISPNQAEKKVADKKLSEENQILTDKTAESQLNLNDTEVDKPKEKTETTTQTVANSQNQQILTEGQALESLPAIPLYFPASYLLVKPYVQGFDSNALDAPSLKNVKIDYDWQPSNRKIISNGQN